MRPVIQCWQQRCNNVERDGLHGFWGMGDLIRGTLGLLQFSRKYGFQLIIDIHKHPVSVFFAHPPSEYAEFLDTLGDDVPFVTMEETIKWIINSKEWVVPMLTNEWSEHVLTDDDKHYMRNFLQFKPDMEHMLRSYIPEIPIFYGVMHFRLGDKELLYDQREYDYQNLLEYILRSRPRNYPTVLLTDSMRLRQYVYENTSEIIVPLPYAVVGHTGFDDDMEKLKNTMIDFLIIRNAKFIHTHNNCYPSQFTYWAAKIYDIPLVFTDMLMWNQPPPER